MASRVASATDLRIHLPGGMRLETPAAFDRRRLLPAPAVDAAATILPQLVERSGGQVAIDRPNSPPGGTEVDQSAAPRRQREGQLDVCGRSPGVYILLATAAVGAISIDSEGRLLTVTASNRRPC